MNKKLISLLTALSVIFTLVPTGLVFAEDSTAVVDELIDPTREERLADEQAHLAEEEARRAEEEARRAEMEQYAPETMTHEEALVRQAQLDRFKQGVSVQNAGLTLMASSYSEVVYISTVDDLLSIDGHSGGYYELTNDINLSGISWQPLALDNATFNGNGYTISNLNITSEPTSNTIGFISGTNNYIDSLNISGSINVTVSSFKDISFVGDAYSNNCSITGDITVNVSSGNDISAYVYGINSGSRCNFTGDINAVNSSICGLSDTVNSDFSGDISATDSCVYGIAGYYSYLDYSYSTINCSFTGDIIVDGTGYWIYAYGIDYADNCSFCGNISATDKGVGIASSNKCCFYGDISIDWGSAYGIYVEASYSVSANSCNFFGDINVKTYGYAFGIYVGSSYVSVNNCNFVGDITIMEGDAYGICGGVNCSLRGNMSTTNGIAYGITGGVNCSLRGNITSTSDGTLGTGANACGIYGSVNCSLNGDVKVTNYAGGATGIEGSSNCSLNGDVTAINAVDDPVYLYGISGCDNCKLSGDVAAISNEVSAIDENTKYIRTYGISGSSNCYIQGDVTAKNKRAFVYGIDDLCDGCYISGGVTATSTYGTVSASPSNTYQCIYRCDGDKNCELTEVVNYYSSNYITTAHAHDGSTKLRTYIGCVVTAAYYTTDNLNTDPDATSAPVPTPDNSDESAYYLQIVDKGTGAAVSGAVIDADGAEYVTDDNGTAKVSGSVNIGGLSVTVGDVLLYTTTNYHALTNQVNVIEINGLQIDTDDLFIGNSATQSIQGPSMEIAGKPMALFDFPFSMDLGFMDLIKIAYDADNQTWQILMGAKTDEDLNGLSDESNADDESWIKQYNEYKEIFEDALTGNLTDTKLTEVNGGKKKEASFTGYMFLEVSGNETLEIESGGLVLTASLGFSGGMPVPACPAVYFAFGVSGSLTGKLSLELEKAEYLDPGFKVTGSASFDLGANAGAGIGAKNMLSLEVGLMGGIGCSADFPFESFEENFAASFSASVYAAWCILGFSSSQSQKFVEYELYPNQGFVDLMELAPPDSLTLADRDYLNSVSLMSDNGTFKSGVYTYTNIQAAMLDDGRMIMVWLDDDAERSDVNRTALYYSILDGDSWSTPAQIESDGMADFAFDLTSCGSTAAIVWQDTNSALADDADIYTIANNIELSYAEFDGSAWGTPVSVTSGNSSYEYNPNVYYDGATAYVQWSQNDTNTPLVGNENTSENVYTATVSGTASGADTVVSGIAYVYGTAVGYGTTAVIADTDGDYTTDGTTLYINGASVYESENTMTQLVYANGSYYFSDGTSLYQIPEDASSEPSEIFEGDAESIRFITNGSNSAAVYEVADGFTSELYAAYLTNGTWSSAVPITDYGKKIRSWSAVMDDEGNIKVAAALADISVDTDAGTVDQSVSIAYTDAYPIEDVSVIGMEADSVTAGSTAEFDIYVVNNTASTIETLNVTISGGTSGTLYEDEVDTYIESGAGAAVTVSVDIPEDFVKQSVTAEVSVSGLSESDTDNNSAEITAGLANIETKLSGTLLSARGIVKIKVENTGCDDAENVTVTLTSSRDGELYSENIGTLAAGESTTVSISVDEANRTLNGESIVFTATATTDTEETIEYDNTSKYTLSEDTILLLYATESSIGIAPGESITPTIKALPSTADISALYALSSDETIATVDDNGTITAVSEGTATITYMTPGTSVSASVTVYVRDTGTVEITSAEYSGGYVYVTADTTCLADEETATMITAVYDENDTLITVDIRDVTSSTSATSSIYISNAVPKRVKVMLWSDISDMKPVSYAVEKEL